MSMPEKVSADRPLTPEEHHLVRWMLENGKPEAKQYVLQLDAATVTPWRCLCGCASFNLAIEGRAAPTGGMQILGDFVFGEGEGQCGIFVFAQDGTLAGVEAYGFAGDAPKVLPTPEDLRPFPKAAGS